MLRAYGRTGLNVAMGLILLAPVGCRVDVESPPVVVEDSPPQGEVIVQEEPAPPAVIYEDEPRPRDGYYWVHGYQQWYHGHYRWRGGYWVRIEPGRHWHEAHWEQGPRGYIWIEGRWD